MAGQIMAIQAKTLKAFYPLPSRLIEANIEFESLN
jgi:hypothetical protein